MPTITKTTPKICAIKECAYNRTPPKKGDQYCVACPFANTPRKKRGLRK